MRKSVLTCLRIPTLTAALMSCVACSDTASSPPSGAISFSGPAPANPTLGAPSPVGSGSAVNSSVGFGDPVSGAGGGASVTGSGSVGEVGVTPGGAQDIAFARAQIAAGLLPPASAITVEGLLSEHDLPAGGAACSEYLCLRPSLGVVPKPDGTGLERWLMLGMASAQKTPFEAPPLDVVVLIDKSASMSIDMPQTAHAVTTLVDRLRDTDRVAVLSFDSTVHTLREPGPVADRAQLNAQINALRAGGGADMMAGLNSAFAAADQYGRSAQRVRRVLLLSCGYPSTGGDYPATVRAAAERGIGLTFIGVLLGFNHDLANTMSQAAGGNYFFLDSLERTASVIVDEFDFMMTPLAYDFSLRLELTNGYTLERVFGLPGDQVGAPRSELKVATLFPSKRHGALLVKLRATEGQAAQELGSASLSYRPETALGFDGSSDKTVALSARSDPNQAHYDSVGVRKAIALVQEADGMRSALERRAAAPAEAGHALDLLATFLEAEASALNDAPLRAEAKLVRDLRMLFAP